MPWNRSGVSRLIPSPTWVPFPPLPATLGGLPRGALVVDVGAGGRRVTPAAVAIDTVSFPGTRLRSDAHSLSLRDRSVDCLVSTGTLEHLQDPAGALEEFHRVLKPGGIVHIEVPFIFPFHPDPLDHGRWTLSGLREFCSRRGFEEVRSGVHIGPASALNMVLLAYAGCYFEGRWARRTIQAALSLALAPHKYLDRFLVRRRHAQDLACGVYFVGRRRES